MKKSLFGFVALAAMLGATSCSQEADLNGTGKSDKFTFKVNVDDVIGTRGLSDGTGATKLLWQVFNDDNSELVESGETTVSGLTATVEVALISGETYNAVFWAQNPDCNAYTLGEDGTITVDYQGVLNNDETMDAFFANATVSPSEGNMEESVELKRPFAQVNVGVLVDNFSGLGIANSSMTIDKYYTTLNLLNGNVGGETTEALTFDTNAVPATTDYFTVTPLEGEAQNYNYISTTYVLVGADRENFNLDFAFGGTKSYTLEYGNVPMQRNYRTNITTEQEMEKFAFNIVVVPAWEGDINDLNGTLEEADQSEEPGQTVSVSDVTASVSGGNVEFAANFTGDVTSAKFVCTPATRAAEGTVEVEATIGQGTLSATSPVSNFPAASYTVTIEVNGETVQGEGATGTLTGTGTGTEQPGEPQLKTETVTYAFSTNSYGQTVYDNNNSNGYPANGTTMVEGGVTVTINPGGQGSGCRFWSTGSAQQFRVMKNSNISVSVAKGNITNIELTGGKLTPANEQSAVSSWTGSAESVTLTNTSSGTINLTEMKVTYEYTE